LRGLKNDPDMELKSSTFGFVDKQTEVKLYEIINNNGVHMKVTNYGAIITSIVIPDKNGRFGEIAMGFDNLNQYLGKHPYFGAVCGRYANRISKGKFTIDGLMYALNLNDGNNSLHGGIEGFDKKVWSVVKENNNGEKSSLVLEYLSKDMEEGYPGNLKVKVTYTLTNLNEIIIEYDAETDKPTVLNLTNHTYFSLNGCKKSVYDHELEINADQYTPVDKASIPTGEIAKVSNTALDFRHPKKIGKEIGKMPNGYDHNFVLNKPAHEFGFCARVTDPDSGRIMEVHTTEPAVQLYTGNYLDGTLIGHGNSKYQKQYGFCLETQHYPDSPNHAAFPSTLLKPGLRYYQKTRYTFGIQV